jgi:predicted lysophospholipase L1 biosynthesis ABC-type transport system permease subunit
VEATPAVFSLVGWPPDAILPVVLSGDPGRLVPDGSSLTLLVGDVSVAVSRAAAVPHVPGSATGEDLAGAGTAPALDTGTAPTVVLDGTRLARALITGRGSTAVTEWWASVPEGRVASLLAALHAQQPDAAVSTVTGLTGTLQAGPLRVVVQPALLLAVLAGAVLVAVGFAAQAAATLRARRSELAQLVAIGLPRARVVGVVALESMLVCLVGAVIGVAAGLVVALVAGPALAVGAGGAAPFPAVRVVLPWPSIAALVAEVVAVLAVVVAVTAGVQRRSAPAELIRAGRDA